MTQLPWEGKGKKQQRTHFKDMERGYVQQKNPRTPFHYRKLAGRGEKCSQQYTGRGSQKSPNEVGTTVPWQDNSPMSGQQAILQAKLRAAHAGMPDGGPAAAERALGEDDGQGGPGRHGICQLHLRQASQGSVSVFLRG